MSNDTRYLIKALFEATNMLLAGIFFLAWRLNRKAMNDRFMPGGWGYQLDFDDWESLQNSQEPPP